MNQEREKVLIKKKLPKIEEQLKSDIACFQQRTGRMIMIDGNLASLITSMFDSSGISFSLVK